MSEEKRPESDGFVRVWQFVRTHRVESLLYLLCAVLLIAQVFVLCDFFLLRVGAASGVQQTTSPISINIAQPPAARSGKPAKPPAPACCQLDGKFDQLRKELEQELKGGITDFQTSRGDLLKQAQANFEAVLAKELILVSLYTVLVGLTTLFSLASARKEARDQMNEMKADLQLAKTDAEEKIKDSEARAKDEMETFGKTAKDKVLEIQESFPEFRAMKQRVQEILAETKRVIDAQTRWTTGATEGDEDLGDDLLEADRQRIFLAEMTIAGLSAFSLERSDSLRSNLVGIYNGFARFYMKQMNRANAAKAADFGDPDYQRALMYASRSTELAPDKPGVARMLGSIKLARFELIQELQSKTKDVPGVNEATQAALLAWAENDFERALPKDDAKVVDAGAFYNLALVHYYRNDLEKAVLVSRRLVSEEKIREKVSKHHREKYLPDTYLNMAGFLAKQAEDIPEGTPERDKLCEEVLQTIEDAVAEFNRNPKSTAGLDRLVNGVERELGGDFSSLEEAFKVKLAKIVSYNRKSQT